MRMVYELESMSSRDVGSTIREDYYNLKSFIWSSFFQWIFVNNRKPLIFSREIQENLSTEKHLLLRKSQIKKLWWKLILEQFWGNSSNKKARFKNSTKKSEKSSETKSLKFYLKSSIWKALKQKALIKNLILKSSF